MYVGPHIKSLRALVTAGATIALLAATLTLASAKHRYRARTLRTPKTARVEPTWALWATRRPACWRPRAAGRPGTATRASGPAATPTSTGSRSRRRDAIRIGLTSADADSYLYLLTEDGSRITDDDDNGDGLDARVERDLAPGTYLVEATTVGGRRPGPGRLHAHREPGGGMRFRRSRHAGARHRPDRVGNVVARHVRLALRDQTSRPRLLLQSARTRTGAHRPRVRERRPRPVTGVTVEQANHRRKRRWRGRLATPASINTCNPVSTSSRRPPTWSATSSPCGPTSPSPSTSWTSRPTTSATG